MAVGDDAVAAGFAIVDGSTTLVKDVDLEINRTRDYVANVKTTVPTSKTAYRTAAGISSGTADPSGGADGDIYLKIVT